MIKLAKGGSARGRNKADKDVISFEQIVRKARNVPGAPDCSIDNLRGLLRCSGTGVFARGDEVRSYLAALDIPLVDALLGSQWWPDMRWGCGISDAQRVEEGLRLMGLRTTGVQAVGRRVVVTLAA